MYHGRLSPYVCEQGRWVRREVKHDWEIDKSTPLQHHTRARHTCYRDARVSTRIHLVSFQVYTPTSQKEVRQ